MIYKTKEEACRAWVNEFNAIPADMALQGDDIWDDWYFFGSLDESEIDEDDEKYGSVGVPMWSTFWMLNDPCDERWLEENREAVADLGFTIIENYENGWILLGIDGAGYSFFNAHWLPLYDLRGLKWHKGAWDE